MTEEEWRAVVGYEGLYEVSSLGNVRSVDRTVRLIDKRGRLYQVRRYTGQALRPAIHTSGYPQVHLSRRGKVKGWFVHVLVCEAFHGPRPSDLQAAHGDGDRRNARKENLRWATRAENMQDAIAHGTSYRGNRVWNARLNPQKVRAIRAAVAAGARQETLAAKFGVRPVAIHQVVKRKTWAWVD